MQMDGCHAKIAVNTSASTPINSISGTARQAR